MKFTINTGNNKYIVDRFNKYAINTNAKDSDLTISVRNNSIILENILGASWLDIYNRLINKCESRLSAWYADNSNSFVRSISGVTVNDGHFLIVPGRLISANYGDSNEVLLGRIGVQDKKSPDAILLDLFRCQLCLYHFLNSLVHRHLNPEPPYGTLLRYLSAQAYWNLCVCSRAPSVKCISTFDKVIIVLDYQAQRCVDAIVEFEIDITVEQGDNLGLLGVYIDEISKDIAPYSYTIYRDFVTASGIHYELTDITNPADCIWQKDGTWTRAKIKQTFGTPGDAENPGKGVRNAKSVFVIGRNPYATGTFKRNSELDCVFKITSKVKLNDEEFNYETTCSCASLIDGFENPEITEETGNNDTQ